MKRKFDVITDSGCDMPEKYFKEKYGKAPIHYRETK